MTLPNGTRLGRYEIVSPLGAGGMGEVYRARDVELDREVAVKVLPSHIASQTESRLRFEREARAISALNHPHICTLHDVGREGDIAFFVMELVNGESLATRLGRGKLPLDHALSIASQIATALSVAHRRGIVHRDLKPANVMLTRTGVKLLDFGIARLVTPTNQSDDSAAPTIAGAVTEVGTIMGTLQYMAPEQLEGAAIDERADIFALGCILYELVSGRRAFPGTSQASIITAIMSSEPPALVELEPVAPPGLERLIRKCLEKSREDRWQDAADLATALSWLREEGPETETSAGLTAAAPVSKRAWLWPAVAVAMATVAVITFALTWNRKHSAPPPARFTIPLYSALPDTSLLSQQMSLSPDGRYLAFVASRDGKSSLWIRPFDGDQPVPIPETAGASAPFWSPDSSHIAFFSGGKLLRVAREGGDVRTISSTSPGAIEHGAWGEGGTIVFDEINGRPGLFRVAASGGEAVLIPGTDGGTERRPAWPVFVDSNRVLYCTVSSSSEKSLTLVYLDGSQKPRDLGPITSRVQIVGDQMLFVRDGTLYAQRFDSNFQRVGEPVRIARHVGYYGSLGTAAFTASSHVITYFSSVTDSRLTWFDRAGNATDIPGIENVNGPVRISLDGRKTTTAVLDPRSGTTDAWLVDLARGGTIRLTSLPGSEGGGLLSPDGRTFVFGSDQDGPPHLFIQSLASATADVLTPRRGIQSVRDWSSDGSFLFFDESDPTTQRDIWIVDARPSSRPRIWLQTPSNEMDARLSHDRKWVAFTSNISGRDEVYVAPFDRPAERLKISMNGGRRPAWRRDGSELFYMTQGGALYRVAIRTEPELDASAPELLFRSTEGTWMSFDAEANGDRFLISRQISGPRNRPIEVVTNWMGLVPAK